MSTQGMRAARIIGPRSFVVEQAPLPSPGPGEVRFRVEGCGVCASNLGPWFGLPWTSYPLGPGESGHEAWGVVDAVGAGVSSSKLGQRVAALSSNAYAEYDVADVGSVLALPSELGEQPFPAEPFGCAMNIFQRSDIRAGHTVAVIGVGFLGALLTRLASLAGARVIAISQRAFSRSLAERMGASSVLALDDHHAIIERVSELTGGKLCERVIECTGKQWPLDLGAELTATRGRLVIAGYHQDGARQVNMQLWNWRGLDVVNAHEREPSVYVAGMRAALSALSERKIDSAPLLTHRFSLESLGAALDATAERPEGFIKALVLP